MNYIFRKDTSTDEENEALFLKVQDYILKSKRFVHWFDAYWHTVMLLYCVMLLNVCVFKVDMSGIVISADMGKYSLGNKQNKYL